MNSETAGEYWSRVAGAKLVKPLQHYKDRLAAAERGEPVTPAASAAPWTENGKPVHWRDVNVGGWKPSSATDGVPQQRPDGRWNVTIKTGECTTGFPGCRTKAEAERYVMLALKRFWRSMEGRAAELEYADGRRLFAGKVTNRVEYRAFDENGKLYRGGVTCWA